MIQDLRYSLRAMVRNPGFTVVAVLALALGIGANTAVFTVLNGVLLRPLPFREPARLMLVSLAGRRGPFGPGLGMWDGGYLEYRQGNRSFESLATFNQSSVTLTGAGEPVRLAAADVTSTLLPMLDVKPAIGRSFELADERAANGSVVLLGDALWRTRFGGDVNVLGKEINLNGSPRRVIGVMPAGFAFPFDAQLWTPLEVRVMPGNSWTRPVAGRLKAGVSQAQALAELESFGGATDPRANLWARVMPLKDLLVSQVRDSLVVFSGAVAFVLLIACANVANLLLMRAASRRQEIAVRAAMGAGRWRLIRQLLTESLTISLTGGAAGLLLALWGVPALLAMAPKGRVPRLADIHIDGWVLAFSFGISVITGLIFGLVPAVETTRRRLRESLSFGARISAGRGAMLRNGLVVAEIALALVLLAGAGLMIKSFLRMSMVDPGFQVDNAVAMTVDLPSSVYRGTAEMRAFHTRVLDRLAEAPGVLSAGAVNWQPLGRGLIRGDVYADEPAKKDPTKHDSPDKLVVSPNYFRAIGIRLLSGRDFSERDTADAPRVMIVSASVARKFWPGEDPIGKRITGQDVPKPEDWMAVVGVVDDIRQSGPTRAPEHAVYYPYLQTTGGWLSHMSFVVRTAPGVTGVPAAMRAALGEVDANLPAQSLATMRDIVAGTTAEPLFQARLLTAFSLLALVLAAIGVYGVLAYSVATRTHEIGIRMALGAERSDVMRMVLRRTLVLAGTGVILGAAGSIAATRVLRDLLFEVKPTDQTTLVLVSVVLGLVALAAGWIPAMRATRVDPLVALRYE